MNKAFEGKLELLCMLGKRWDANRLFIAEAQGLIGEVVAMQLSGASPEDYAACLGGLQGVIAAQEVWLNQQAAGLVDAGIAEWT